MAYISDDDIQFLTGEVATQSRKLQILQRALDLATEGFKTDQVRIDSEIQKGKDEVAQQITDLTDELSVANGKISEHKGTITDLTQQVKDLITENTTLKTASSEPLPNEPENLPAEDVTL